MVNRKVDIIGIQMDLGASRRGVNMGPLAIRCADLCNKMTELGIQWRDKGDIIPRANGKTRPDLKNYEQVIEANRRLYDQTLESLKSGALPVILGGDHSVAAGSIPAVARHYGGIGVIWIDAHGDFNNHESSLSGNMHGMPFSAVCGFGPSCMMDYGGETVFVDPTRSVQIAGRDIEVQERMRMRQAGVTVFSISDVDRLGMAEVMRRAIRIAGSGTAGIHISFDVDSVTPEEAPGTGTPVHSGITVREAFLAAEMIAESDRLISLDMVEVNPILDQHNKTGILATELILSMLGKTVF